MVRLTTTGGASGIGDQAGSGAARVENLVAGLRRPYMPQRSLEHNANYCHGTVLRFREILPFVEVHSPEVVATH